MDKTYDIAIWGATGFVGKWFVFANINDLKRDYFTLQNATFANLIKQKEN